MADQENQSTKEERGRIQGDAVIAERYVLWGTIVGDVRVLDGGKFWMRGNVQGDLIVEYGGRVHVFGQVSGSLFVARGAKVIVSGLIHGPATNDGGRLFIEPDGRILGKITTKRGDTVKKDNLTFGEDDLPNNSGSVRDWKPVKKPGQDGKSVHDR
ncbi:MAG: polymer-forming cytoskeletal protein [Planctomycetota bacterium]